MTGALCMAAYVAVVCALSAAATGQLLPHAAQEPPGRGWFPGGEEDEPEPAPQPEQQRHVPSWARP